VIDREFTTDEENPIYRKLVMDPVRNDDLGTTDFRIRNSFTGKRTLFTHFWKKYQNSAES